MTSHIPRADDPVLTFSVGDFGVPRRRHKLEPYPQYGRFCLSLLMFRGGSGDFRASSLIPSPEVRGGCGGTAGVCRDTAQRNGGRRTGGGAATPHLMHQVKQRIHRGIRSFRSRRRLHPQSTKMPRRAQAKKTKLRGCTRLHLSPAERIS